MLLMLIFVDNNQGQEKDQEEEELQLLWRETESPVLAKSAEVLINYLL